MSTKLKSPGSVRHRAGAGRWSRGKGTTRIVVGALMALLAPALPLQAAVQPITGNHRLVRSFVEDAAIVEEGWVEFAAAYEDYPDGGHDFTGGIVLAFRFGRDVEAGLKTAVLDRRREAGSDLFGSQLAEGVDGTGIADPMVYGKYRIVRSPFDLAVGAAARLPLADEDAGRGPGVFQYEAFVALRQGFSSATMIWSLAASDRRDAESPGGADGRTSVRVGAGVLVPVSLIWTFILEADYEGARFEGEGDAGRALVGLDWRPTRQIAMRVGVGAGLTDAAGNLSGAFSLLLYF